MASPDAIHAANLDTVSRWVHQASDGLLRFEFDSRSFHSLRLTSGENIGMNGDRPVTGIGFGFNVSDCVKLDQRKRMDMKVVVDGLNAAVRVLEEYGRKDLAVDVWVAADRFARRNRLKDAR